MSEVKSIHATHNSERDLAEQNFPPKHNDPMEHIVVLQECIDRLEERIKNLERWTMGPSAEDE